MEEVGDVLRDRVAIVVGASRGIGRAYALALARAGAAVVVAGRTVRPPGAAAVAAVPAGRRHLFGLLPGTIGEVARAIGSEGGRALAVRCDIRREEDVRQLIERTLAEFGRIDVLVNNAAVFPRYESLAVPLDEWDFNLEVNVRGPYLTARYALPHMIARRSGSVIDITSSASRATTRASAAGSDLIMYSISKAALERLTTYLAEEMRPYGIAVNALSPGPVLTEGSRDTAPPGHDFEQDLHRWKPATPEVLGPALLYLARQSADGLTGQILHTDQFGKSWP